MVLCGLVLRLGNQKIRPILKDVSVLVQQGNQRLMSESSGNDLLHGVKDMFRMEAKEFVISFLERIGSLSCLYKTYTWGSVTGCYRFHLTLAYCVVGCSEQQMAHNFFTGISRVREMIISRNMMERIFSYLSVDSLPQFCNLSYLKGNVCSTSVTFLDVFTKLLESCPNLKSIVLGLTCFTDYTDEMVEMRVWSVPKCLLSSLEFVEIKNEYEADDGALEVARYFVENSVNLKKLVLHLASSFLKQGNPALLKDLIALPRRSSMCQIEVFNGLNGRALGIF
ncbi:FBD domain [Arabidopsis thaliana x Arabidopsis arenosa]|uniref:FBD domain n=1 Tax=Arabidopsis thaliana x Arabidopsis arenosa TaxID=1240361 RepID=A0A8T2A869_9BRAS|nr:FBD domain [Arabidopsis thaliana x Arabidopsis arenosa]